jgi:hypothetical protein
MSPFTGCRPFEEELGVGGQDQRWACRGASAGGSCCESPVYQAKTAPELKKKFTKKGSSAVKIGQTRQKSTFTLSAIVKYSNMTVCTMEYSTIPFSKIGWIIVVIYCRTDDFCNPSLEIVSNKLKNRVEF